MNTTAANDQANAAIASYLEARAGVVPETIRAASRELYSGKYVPAHNPAASCTTTSEFAAVAGITRRGRGQR